MGDWGLAELSVRGRTDVEVSESIDTHAVSLHIQNDTVTVQLQFDGSRELAAFFEFLDSPAPPPDTGTEHVITEGGTRIYCFREATRVLFAFVQYRAEDRADLFHIHIDGERLVELLECIAELRRALWRTFVVFVAWSEVAAIVELLESRLGKLAASEPIGDELVFESESQWLEITTHVEGGEFSQLEIRGFNPAWETSHACARWLAAAAGRTTRVDPPELADPELPLALEIDPAGHERLVEWVLERDD